MNKHISIIVKFAIALLMAMTGSAITAQAANASDGDSVTVESTSYAETSAKADIKAETLAVVDGATQVTWEVPNHNVKVTAKQLKKAAWVKVKATGANSSKVVYKTAKAKLYKVYKKRFFKKYKKTLPRKEAKQKAKTKATRKAVKDSRVVVLKPGSCVRNRGMRNRLPLGFVWCPQTPVVLKYDGKSNQYRHSHSLLTASNLEALKQELKAQDRLDELEVVGTVKIGGVKYFIVKWCLNYIGGNIEMAVKVIQVRYTHNLLMDVALESHVESTATVKASLQCPTGTLYGEASASASGSASADFRVMLKYRDSKVRDEKARILAEARGKARTAAKTAASAKVKLECGSTPPPPPPPVDNPPVVHIYGAPAHLYTGGNAALWIEASDPDDDALQVSVRAGGQNTCQQENGKYTTNCVTGLIPMNVRWDGTPCPAGVKCYRATAWAGSTPGNFTAIAKVIANGEPVETSISFPVMADEF